MGFMNEPWEVNLISEEDLLKELKKLRLKQKEYRKSLRHPSDCKLRCGKIDF